LLADIINSKSTICSEKEQALRFAYGLEILRYPSLPIVNGFFIGAIGAIGAIGGMRNDSEFQEWNAKRISNLKVAPLSWNFRRK
jgi:hypothetical protein